MFKRCSKCEVWKTLDCFSAHRGKKSSGSGVRAACKECEAIYNREYEKTRIRNYDKDYYEKNKKTILAQAANYYEQNKTRILQRVAEYQISKPEVARAATSKRRASKLQRTPRWADLEKIAEFYANCPDGYEVDHIIPLQGELVSGLHVHNNLQYLTKKENASKSNKWSTETEIMK